jgi:TetR/AcrR family transcriptional repressor of nem operon
MPRAINVGARERIVSTALGLFTERGYKSVSMDDIAFAAGLKKANLFHYFPTKEALGRGALELAASRFRARLEEELTDEALNPVDAVVKAFEKIGERMSPQFGNPVLYLLVEMSSSSEGLRDALAESMLKARAVIVKFLCDRQSQGQFTEEFNPELAASVFLSLMHGARLISSVMRAVDPYSEATKALRDHLTLYYKR